MKKLLIIAAYALFTVVLLVIGIAGVFGTPAEGADSFALIKLVATVIGIGAFSLWYKVTTKLAEHYGIEL